MTSRNFIQYLRDAKLLNKNKFNINDAEIIFDKIKIQQNIISNTLDCPNFISGLNILADRIGIDRDLLITKLAKVEYQADTKSKALRNNKNNNHNNHNNNVTESSNEETNIATTVTTSTGNNVSDEKSAAAIKLQRLSRERAAKKQLHDLREIHNSTNSQDLINQFVEQSEVVNHPEIENKLLDVFTTYCPDNEMNLEFFLRMVQDTKGLLNQTNFTLNDCKYCFEKVKTISLNSNTFNSEVILEKRITYVIFRKLLIPCMAQRYGKDFQTFDIVKFFIEIPSNKVEALNAANFAAQNLFSKGMMNLYI